MARPRIEIDISQVEAMAGRGLTEEQIAHSLGISHDTLFRRKKDSAEFREAIKKGKAKGLRQITNSLFTSATNGNVTAQIFYLVNRDPENWRHINRIDHISSDGSMSPKKDIALLSDEALYQIATGGGEGTD